MPPCEAAGELSLGGLCPAAAQAEAQNGKLPPWRGPDRPWCPAAGRGQGRAVREGGTLPRVPSSGLAQLRGRLKQGPLNAGEGTTGGRWGLRNGVRSWAAPGRQGTRATPWPPLPAPAPTASTRPARHGPESLLGQQPQHLLPFLIPAPWPEGPLETTSSPGYSPRSSPTSSGALATPPALHQRTAEVLHQGLSPATSSLSPLGPQLAPSSVVALGGGVCPLCRT